MNHFQHSPCSMIRLFFKYSEIFHIYLMERFIRDHPDILVTRADKGNITVVVNREDYISKIELMLGDRNVYELVNRDTTSGIQRNLNVMVTSWKSEGRILESEAKSLKSYHGTVAKLYGLPKIHKVNVPYRPIVSTIGTPLYELSGFVSRILNTVVGKSSSAIKNSVDFKQKIRNIVLPQDHIILSLDVVSLFTNIDSSLVLELIGRRWAEIKRISKTKLTKLQFMEAMKLILYNCEFCFNNKIYRQLFGSPMGSPTSPAVAELVMEFVEQSVLGSLNFTPIFYYRYVDDIVLAIPKQEIDNLFACFNNFNENIKFTIELEDNQKLPFLDLVIIHNVDGSLSTDWYHKTSWSGRYLNYHSHLPFSYKKNTVRLLSTKILQLSDPIYHGKNFRLLKSTLSNNGYPNSLVNSIIYSVRFNNSTSNEIDHSVENVFSENDIATRYITIPYVSGLFEKISYCLRKYNFKTVGKAYNSLGCSIFSSLKDPTPLGNHKNIVYKITCQCNNSYIGQTKQLLHTRFNQHKRDAKKLTLKKVNSDLTSALSTHLHETNHEIYMENVRVLEKEANHATRRVLEMIHIKTEPNSLNKQADCSYLQNTYNHLLQNQ